MAFDLLKTTGEYISVNHLLGDGDPLLIGVSGGVDSMALLLVLAALAPAARWRLLVAHVNHGLRPDEAGAELRLVRDQAERLGLDFCSETLPVKEYAVRQGLSLEAAARELRYEFFMRRAGEFGGAKIAVGHTADDQAEELLIRLLRGTGLIGLSGMAPLNFRGVIRPFLAVPKQRLREYLAVRKISYLEDSSNTSREFLRNRVRLELLPLLARDFNPAIRQTLLNTADILTLENDYLAEQAGDVFRKTVELIPPGGFDSGGRPKARLDLRLLEGYHPALRARIMTMILVKCGNSPSFARVRQLLKMAERGRTGSELHLGGGLLLIHRGDSLEFSCPGGWEAGRLPADRSGYFELEIPGPGRYPVDELGITIVVREVPPPPREILGRGRGDYLDCSSKPFPLLVRSPKAGDRFHPLGGPGRRKVSDFLSDRKIPRDHRWRQPVLLCAGEVAAILGTRIDQRRRITSKTRSAVKITLE